MKIYKSKLIWAIFFMGFVFSLSETAFCREVIVLDDFENIGGWKKNMSEGNRLDVKGVATPQGKTLYMDFDLGKELGWVQIGKEIDLEISPDAEFILEMAGSDHLTGGVGSSLLNFFSAVRAVGETMGIS